ncbi:MULTISPECIES: phosphoenolpyruvate--protein phosphotransferase [Kaistia]|uniref:phosphoenolpyruvate--protein phosphotransferase n=1 Tax=Kaistia nematophila TaxID=2994654 RepID=A0A9X3IMI4_9HYPH|nr:phosphoenolpyruvate--protein phosphotransferase [Kaistia nematophila]MBN9026480.1 phosphoenolpyruvate--protein phosphotransferase [Hyphomicrobiales bacterium]MCX5571593.1 phosphoenolpyruvate--protein phosphotransferase [Kaistia nematophila]
MRGSLAGPRVLLRRLREIMAEPISAQDRLDKIVAQIAANMVAEVCSVYVLRADDVLELYATEGLNRSAVHHAGLRVGQGLVGLIASEARPLNLQDAQSHPSFAYLPETGEEIYNAFLGVPILRAGRTLGVLVVQNRAHRTYYDEEVEALQTTAMVLAEMIAVGELQGLARPGTSLDVKRPLSLKGTPLSDGIALGHVVLHEPRVVVTQLIAEDTDKESRRLEQAIANLRLSVDDMLSRDDIALAGEHRDILEAYRMFAYDRGWVRRMDEAIQNGLSAEAAVEKVQSDTRARLQRQTDPYLRERLHDFDDLANRLLRELMGKSHGPDGASLPKDSVIVARNMGAAELLDYDRNRVRGLVLEEGGATSHVTIVARALGIATIGRAANIVSLVENGDPIILDADTGEAHVRPPADVEAAYGEKVKFRAKRQAQYRLLRNKPAVTQDGHRVSLNMNAGLLVDLPHLAEAGAEGIGLFRTELQFMVASTMPRMDEQTALYAAVLQSSGNRPVTFRTLDIGGDKVLPYMRMQPEENPALGWRAIRLGLDRPGLLRMQLRALLHAAAGRELRVMLPMVTEVGEIHRARALLDREVAQLRRHGHGEPSRILLGSMVEVPALLFQLDSLMQAVDFVSVGSNDLLQYMTASDRGNPRVASRFDPLSRHFLRTLRMIVEGADRHETPVTLCGEIASRPLAAMALAGIGFRSLSMSAAAIGPVKAMLLALDIGRLKAVLDPLLALDNGEDGVRAALVAFAEAEGIPI